MTLLRILLWLFILGSNQCCFASDTDATEAQSNFRQLSSSSKALVEMCKSSEMILVAEFEEMEGPRAYYWIVQLLKGPTQHSRKVPILFSETNSAPNKIPSKGSKWILFIPTTIPINGAYETFGDSIGRVEYSLSNLSIVANGLTKVKDLPSKIELKKMFQLCERVWIADYIENASAEASKETIGTFKIKELLKGSDPGPHPRIKLENNSELPCKNSRWVLFVKDGIPKDGLWSTYEGCEGMLIYSSEVKKTLSEALKLSLKSEIGKPTILHRKIPSSDRNLNDFLKGRSDYYSGVDRRVLPKKAK